VAGSGSEREGRTPNDPAAVARVRAFLEGALARMGLDVQVLQHDEGADVVLEITGRDAAVAIGKKGATLDALQLLCNRVARRGEGQVSIVLDAEGYRARREQSLASMARRLGAQAVKEGSVITLEPMTARDRRVVHMALARFPGVMTRSEGDGLERRLQIIPMPERPKR
jgi:spoIIIJ-associated protein